MSSFYIGRKACGCVVAAVVDSLGAEVETAKDVADFIRAGYSVEHIEADSLNLKRCTCAKQATRLSR